MAVSIDSHRVSDVDNCIKRLTVIHKAEQIIERRWSGVAECAPRPRGRVDWDRLGRIMQDARREFQGIRRCRAGIPLQDIAGNGFAGYCRHCGTDGGKEMQVHTCPGVASIARRYAVFGGGHRRALYGVL
jgi:hypothetical protein